MKKFLALVLALVMTMSLVTISSSAAFVDADSIEYDEAVNVLASLGVIQGKGANTFDPKGGVTRAEMAKMITYIKLGVAEASAFEGTTTDLTDIDGHWAESFIKFCYVEGIIAGKGDGKFDPNANVTTAEAAKMLLVALGYNAGVQGYVGDQWKVAVVRDAYQNDIFEDIGLSADKALNRDESAKLIYNTVLTETIEQRPTLNVDTNSISISYQKNDEGTTLLSESFDAVKYTGVMTFDEYSSVTKKYTYDADLETEDEVAFNAEDNFVAEVDYTDFEGEEVAVIIKDANKSDYSVLGVYPTGKSKVLSDVANAFGVSSAKLKYDGKLYAVSNAALLDEPDSTSMDMLKFVDADGDGKYDACYPVEVLRAKVTSVDDDEVITDEETFKFAEDDIAAGLAVDDYVVYAQYADGSYAVSKVEPFEAKLASINAKDSKVSFDGTWYNVADLDGYTAGKTYKVWAHNGVAFDKKAIDGNDVANLVMVYGSIDSNTVDSEKIAYIDAAGTKTTVVLDKIADDGDAGINASDTTSASYGQLYLKKSTKDGVEFRDITDAGSYKAAVADSFAYDDGTAAEGDETISKIIVDDYGEIKIADDAVVFVYGAANTTRILTGKQLKAVDNGDDVFNLVETDVYVKKVGLTYSATHLAVTYGGNPKDIDAVTGTEIYAYVTSDQSDNAYTTAGDTDVTEFRIWNGTENLTVYIEGENAVKKGDILVYKEIDKDGILKGYEFLNAQDAAVVDISGKSVDVEYDNDSVIVEDTIETTSDTKYLYVNSNEKGDEIGRTTAATLSLAKQFGKEGDGTLAVLRDNIAYVTNDAGTEFVLIVIDVANNMTRKNTGSLEAIEDYTDTTSAKRGDKITLSVPSAEEGGAATTFLGVMKPDGSSYDGVTVQPGKSETVYVINNGLGAAVLGE